VRGHTKIENSLSPQLIFLKIPLLFTSLPSTASGKKKNTALSNERTAIIFGFNNTPSSTT